MTRYTSATDQDRREMLARIGVGSVEDLFEAIPAGLRLKQPLNLPDGMAEQDVYEHLASFARRNRHADEEVTFLGAGMYDHSQPALIDTLISRSEFLTPYTPYQPEISQGTLQAMFEYQTAICELTGMQVSNAGLYAPPRGAAAPAPRGPRPRWPPPAPSRRWIPAARGSWSRAAFTRTAARRS